MSEAKIEHIVTDYGHYRLFGSDLRLALTLPRRKDGSLDLRNKKARLLIEKAVLITKHEYEKEAW